LGGTAGTALGATVSSMVNCIIVAHPNLFFLRVASILISAILVVFLVWKDSGSKSYLAYVPFPQTIFVSHNCGNNVSFTFGRWKDFLKKRVCA
jgi:hypothetical protein